MKFKMSFLIATTTVENKKDAEELAKKIVEKKLGACVHITEVESFYNWKGKLENSKEFKLEIKTSENKYEELEKFIIKNHKYELPEIIAVKIEEGSKKYLNWIEGELR